MDPVLKLDNDPIQFVKEAKFLGLIWDTKLTFEPHIKYHELTVKHILIECNFLKIIRRRHYDVTDLNQLFKTVSSKRIHDFVKDIGLYNSL